MDKFLGSSGLPGCRLAPGVERGKEAAMQYIQKFNQLGQNQLGQIEICPRAIASVARRAAMETYGIVGLSRRVGRGLLQILRWHGARRRIERGVEVMFVDRQVIIDLYVIVEYGTRISEVATNVASSVRFAVERALGLPVVQVNVNVQGMRVSGGE